MSKRPFAVITGGGTGGHVSPALAVAEALVARGRDRAEIEFVGGRRGIEGRLVPEAGFVLHRLPGRGIQRRFTAENVSASLGLLASMFMAVGMAVLHRPRVVVTVGGYAGFPYALAAVVLGVPLVVISVDAVPGAVNRLVGPHAAANAVAFPDTGLPRTTVTGAPVRRAVLDASRGEEARRKTRSLLGVSGDRRLVVVTGGSLGAGSINACAIAIALAWRERDDLAIYHVAGERNLAGMREALASAGLLTDDGRGLEYRLVGFDPALPEALAACDLAVCRAGAMTVAEITAVGVPSILIPLPGAPRDHQRRNAEALATAGAALLIADDLLSPETLGRAIDRCLGDDGRLAAMATAAATLGRRDAADSVAQITEELARRPNRSGRRAP
ncbi:MAG: UDP-N-acetylglucosamine--N-acetylmuramyl-(pentapeptide) pyrophosphoryl-undecaprenol N-acetylglucosamine transferase [Acidimicrobiales bacterium]